MIRGIQKAMGKSALSKMPIAKKNFDKLEQRNRPLAKLVLRSVPRTYHRYKIHEKASEGVAEMMNRAIIVDYTLKELKLNKRISQGFVDKALHERPIKIGEVVQIKRKLGELERLDKQSAEYARDHLQGHLARSPQDALNFIAGLINASKENHGR